MHLYVTGELEQANMRASPQVTAVRKKDKKECFWRRFFGIIQVLNNQVSRRASPQAAAVLY